MADLFIYTIFGFFFGLFLFYFGFSKFRRKRLIENTPTSNIRSVAMCLVEIFGDVIPAKGKILKSPFSNKDCVYYKYEIEEYRSSGKSSRWVKIKDGSDSVHFFLKDKTGLVLVEPKDAEVEIPQDFQFESSMGKDPPQYVKDFLKKNRMSFEGFLGINKKMRYKEHFIAPKDNLYILGTAGDNPFVEEATAQHGIEDVMIQKGKNVFYISDKPEKEVLGQLGFGYFYIIGGAILSTVCLFIILFYLNLL